MKKRYGRFKRRVPGEMNGLEKAYSLRLNDMKRDGLIEDWRYEAVTLVIAEPQVARKSRYTPDFMVLNKDMEVEFHETKGFMRDDAALKLKAASMQYPFRFLLVKRDKIKDGGAWREEEI